MNNIFSLLIAACLFSSSAVAADKTAITISAAPLELGFSDAFNKKFYEKKYFGLAVTGTTVVVAGAVSYFTAGAGAPVAAGGVSTIASWVGGGRAGSYMAGLSTIGSAFGGNAMLGAAILNGVSVATIGGGSTFATLSAAQKGLAMASVSATLLDGVAVVNGTGTGSLNYIVALPTPKRIGSKRMRLLVDNLDELGRDERELSAKIDELANNLVKEQAKNIFYDKDKIANKITETEEKRKILKKKRLELEGNILSQAKNALKTTVITEDMVLLGILSKGLGRNSLFASLVERIPADNVKDGGYVHYLKAVAKIEGNQIDQALKLLELSSTHNPYAIEPTILRLNILANMGFDRKKDEMIAVVSKASKMFDAAKYVTPYSLVSLHYRVGSSALKHKDYSLAEDQFNQALRERSLFEKYGPNNSIDEIIRIGLANAYYGQGRKSEAEDIVIRLLEKAKDGSAREVICQQLVEKCV